MGDIQLTNLVQGTIIDVNGTEMVIGTEIEKEIEKGTGTEKIEFEKTTQDVVAAMRYINLL